MFEASNGAIADGAAGSPPSRQEPAVRDSTQGDVLETPLSSIVIRARRVPVTAGGDASLSAVCPLALRVLHPSPDRHIPAYVYDPGRQIALTAESDDDDELMPVQPNLNKDWTTVEGTHTDGDGGDNELWGWEEVT
jgi:hypothetical protein